MYRLVQTNQSYCGELSDKKAIWKTLQPLFGKSCSSCLSAIKLCDFKTVMVIELSIVQFGLVCYQNRTIEHEEFDFRPRFSTLLLPF